MILEKGPEKIIDSMTLPERSAMGKVADIHKEGFIKHGFIRFDPAHPSMEYKPVIGLEVHVELKTKSKMFCSCKAEYFGEKPNSNTCPVCLGLPGSLPVPNKKAIEWCVMIGLALKCHIPIFSKFDRKNYFYPDLPKGYQISQYDKPFAINGTIVISGRDPSLSSGQATRSQSKEITVPFDKLRARNDRNNKVIRIRRVHMEEDTAKLVHEFGNQKDEGYSLIDFNRSGVPLVEIVTEPDFESATEVVEYLKKLQQIVRYLEVSDADMEKGEMRLEPNISLSQLFSPSPVPSPLEGEGQGEGTGELPPYKVEVKNINSFRFVEKAINYEIERQKQVLNSGKTPLQETRGWDEEKQITVSQRIKEEAMDYRYFPEPDIPPIHWTQYQISKINSASQNQIGELPDQKRIRFKRDYGLSEYDCEILTREKITANFFEESVRLGKKYEVSPKQVANALINKKIDANTTLPAQLIKNILKATATVSIGEKELGKIIKQVILDNPKAISDYKKGKTNVIMFLVGMVLRKISKGVDANIVKKEIERQLF